jgi:glycosyltransferase involved in cell wall biosynthesis
MTKRPVTCVVVPTYNELDNLRPLIESILTLSRDGTNPALEDLCVINVDDNSPDGTGDEADRLAAMYPGRVEALHRPKKLGLGGAHLAGFARALHLGAQIVITMDADFSHHPRYVPAILEKRGDADVVIGSRYVPGGGVSGWPWDRRVLSRTANLIARLSAGVHVRDTTTGFRLYRREVLESIPLDHIFSSGYAFMVEMLFLVQERGWRVAEIPIILQDRQFGSSKISHLEISKAVYTLLRLGLRRVVRDA